jgi:autotransporter-associated beta strand protein
LLNAGRLVLGNASALGTGTLSTANGTTLDTNTAGLSVGNAISLTGTLNLTGSNALTLGGSISGSGGLTKAGSASLTLTGNNTYLGNTNLNAGTLVVGSNTALGLGALHTAAGTTLDANTLGNAVNLAGNLEYRWQCQPRPQRRGRWHGQPDQERAANLTLSGANTYQGGTTLNSGTLTVGNALALGTGDLTVAGTANLASTGAQTWPTRSPEQADPAWQPPHPGGVIDGAPA